MTIIEVGFVSNINYQPEQAGHAGQPAKKAYANAFFRFGGAGFTLKAFGPQANILADVAEVLAKGDFGSDKPSMRLIVEGQIRREQFTQDGQQREKDVFFANKVTPVITGSAALQLAVEAQTIYNHNRDQRQRSSGNSSSGSWTRQQAPAPQQQQAQGVGGQGGWQAATQGVGYGQAAPATGWSTR